MGDIKRKDDGVSRSEREMLSVMEEAATTDQLIPKLDYMLDFGSVAVLVNLCYN